MEGPEMWHIFSRAAWGMGSAAGRGTSHPPRTGFPKSWVVMDANTTCFLSLYLKDCPLATRSQLPKPGVLHPGATHGGLGRGSAQGLQRWCSV